MGDESTAFIADSGRNSCVRKLRYATSNKAMTAAVIVVFATSVGLGVGFGLKPTSPVRRATASVWQPSTAMTCLGTTWPNVSGAVTFQQRENDPAVTITVNLAGLPPSSAHGFHVHTTPSLANDCVAAGSHFNPYLQTHGAPNAAVRHIGDLGNVITDSSGRVSIVFTDSVVSLWDSVRSIVNRTMMLHCGADDMGLGSSIPPYSSNTTGNAGNRTACAIIALA